MTNTVYMTLGYEGTDFTRKVSITQVADEDLPNVKNKILAINASLGGGNSDGLDTFFRSDDFDSDEGIGAFTGVTAAKIVSKEITNINLEEEGE